MTISTLIMIDDDVFYGDVSVTYIPSSINVDLTSNNVSAQCPTGSVMTGIHNSGGTKNLKDIDQLECSTFYLTENRLPIMQFKTLETVPMPINFGGTGGSGIALCPPGYLITGLYKGSSDNPNDGAKVYCSRIGLPTSPETQLVPQITGHQFYPTNLETEGTWGRCLQGVPHSIMTTDKGTNIYDMKQFACSIKAELQGPLVGAYNDLAALDIDQQRAMCCSHGLSSIDRDVCALLGHRDGNMSGSCADLGDGYCGSFPNDPVCQEWCDEYPLKCSPEPDEPSVIPPVIPLPPAEDPAETNMTLIIIMFIVGIMVAVSVGMVLRKLFFSRKVKKKTEE